MSKRGYISRYLLLVKKLKSKKYCSYKELRDYIQNQLEFLRMNDDTLEIGLSQRTLQRDIRDIRDLYGLDIQYSKANKGYFIEENDFENLNFHRMMESYEIYNSLQMTHDLESVIYLEDRKPQGTENLYGVIHAIKNKIQIQFDYEGFWEDSAKSHDRVVEPYALKEFRYRWYVISNDTKDGVVKSFALDRLTNFQITGIRFKCDKSFNIDDYYKYSFGIESTYGKEPETIVLVFDEHQGKYIKTSPLHHSQLILKDDEDELEVGLKLCVTHELVMELLSFGDSVTVVEPISLAKRIKGIFFTAKGRYT